MIRRLALSLLILSTIGVASHAVGQEKPPAAPNKIDKDLIIGVWLAHPFDGAGTKPRIEFKKGGKFRALMQNRAEMEGKWQWKEPSTLVLLYPERNREIESTVRELTSETMTSVSSRGRETKYVKLKAWNAKEP